jgi:hypothetical protein
MAISVASASIPRSHAFEIFIGTTNRGGRLSREFIDGMDSALWVSLILLVVASLTTDLDISTFP